MLDRLHQVPALGWVLLAFILIGLSVGFAGCQRQDDIKRINARQDAGLRDAVKVAALQTRGDLLRGCARSNKRIRQANKTTTAVRTLADLFREQAVDAAGVVASIPGQEEAAANYARRLKRIDGLKRPRLVKQTNCKVAYPNPLRARSVGTGTARVPTGPRGPLVP